MKLEAKALLRAIKALLLLLLIAGPAPALAEASLNSFVREGGNVLRFTDADYIRTAVVSRPMVEKLGVGTSVAKV